MQIFIGAGITWFAAWWYYRKAGNELRVEAKELRKISKMILRWQEVDGKNIKLVRDEDGEPQFTARTVVITDAIQSRTTPVGGTLAPPEEEKKVDRMHFSVGLVDGSMDPVESTPTKDVADDKGTIIKSKEDF